MYFFRRVNSSQTLHRPTTTEGEASNQQNGEHDFGKFSDTHRCPMPNGRKSGSHSGSHDMFSCTLNDVNGAASEHLEIYLVESCNNSRSKPSCHFFLLEASPPPPVFCIDFRWNVINKMQNEPYWLLLSHEHKHNRPTGRGKITVITESEPRSSTKYPSPWTCSAPPNRVVRNVCDSQALTNGISLEHTSTKCHGK